MRITSRFSTLALLIPFLSLFSFQKLIKSDSGISRHNQSGLFIKKSLITNYDSFPPHRGWTNDFFKLYSPEQVAILDSVIGAFEKKTSIEICVVTIDSTFTSKDDFYDWITNLHNTWGVGKKDKDNGILVAIAPPYRLMRISNGYGIEGLLSDDETKSIIDNEFTPYFKNGKYFEGTLNGVQAIIAKLNEKLK